MRAETPEPDAAKVELRAQAKRARAGLSASERELAAEQVAVAGAALVTAQGGKVIAGYYPIRDELDSRPLLESLSSQGLSLALPATPPAPGPLSFLEWLPGDPLEEGRFGVMTPPASSPAMDPDIILVPLLAFDAAGHRLGYGAGYYDRTLAALRGRYQVTAIGLAFAEQEMAALPHGPSDQRLDWVVTQSGARPIEG
jgi:5-formyltetrahydrofolate cyclo-ligase